MDDEFVTDGIILSILKQYLCIGKAGKDGNIIFCEFGSYNAFNFIDAVSSENEDVLDRPAKRANPAEPAKLTAEQTYKKLKSNKIIAKFNACLEYNRCKCRPNDPLACSYESNCENAMLNFECDPELCAAKESCQNQNFRRGEQFKFQIKKTDLKGWGLFAQEHIPIGKFVIEYMGEVIDSVEFNKRFSRATANPANKEKNSYFLKLGEKKYIDATTYGNQARFINHSCSPNVVSNKWTVYENDQEQIRIGFFALRDILPVRIHRIHTIYTIFSNAVTIFRNFVYTANV